MLLTALRDETRRYGCQPNQIKMLSKFPNLFATGIGSGIIKSQFVTNQFCQPHFDSSACFHTPTIEKINSTSVQTAILLWKSARSSAG
jgi:hypothetical protein